MEGIRLYTDGGARGNPGPAGAGFVIRGLDNGKETGIIKKGKKFLGNMTNNQAEYYALILGLKAAKELGAKRVQARLDSELIVKQLNREYKVKNPAIAERFLEVHNLLHDFDRVTFAHVRREQNTEADALVNEAIDEHTN